MENQNQGSNGNDATISDVSDVVIPTDSSNNPPPNPDSPSNNDIGGHSNSTDALAKALSSMLTSLIKDFDSKAHDTLASQDLLSSSIDRLTRELDQLLEDAPLPFIMQHAAKFSNVRKRVLSLNSLLKSIQRRVDNIDRILSMGLQHGRLNKHQVKEVEVEITRTIPIDKASAWILCYPDSRVSFKYGYVSDTGAGHWYFRKTKERRLPQKIPDDINIGCVLLRK